VFPSIGPWRHTRAQTGSSRASTNKEDINDEEFMIKNKNSTFIRNLVQFGFPLGRKKVI
jgi:hypothetical protein